MYRRKLEGGKSLIEGMERRGIICPLCGSDRAFVLSGPCQRKGFEMEICRSVWPPKVAQTDSILVPSIRGGSFLCWGNTTLAIPSTPACDGHGERVYWRICLLHALHPCIYFRVEQLHLNCLGRLNYIILWTWQEGDRLLLRAEWCTAKRNWEHVPAPGRGGAIDPRAPRCSTGMREQGLISAAWCKTWASPPRAKWHRGVLGPSGVTVQAEQGTLWCWGGCKSSREQLWVFNLCFVVSFWPHNK